MASRRGASLPPELSSSVESSCSDFLDEYPGYTKRKKPYPESSRLHHLSHRHKSYKKTRRERGSHDDSRSRHHHHHHKHHHHHHRHHSRRKESCQKAIALRISSSSSSSKSETGSTSVSSGSESGKDGAKVEATPLCDWVCGVCSNLNSTQRVECYRCGATYSQSQHAKPSTEVCIRGVPESCNSQDLEAALKAIFIRHGESLDGTVGMQKHRSVWYVQFPSSVESTKALIFCHCRLPLGETTCSMEFSKQRKSTAAIQEAPPPHESQGVEGAPTVIQPLPHELQPSQWRPPSEFASVEDTKRYLETLSAYWQYLSEPQKLYYDEKVKEVLLHPHTSAQNSEPVREGHGGASGVKTNSVGVAERVTNPIETLKRKLEEKKKVVNKNTSNSEAPNLCGKTTEALNTSAKTTTISQLKQRLAEKKAQIAADGRHSHVNSTQKSTPDKNVAQTDLSSAVQDKAADGDASRHRSQTLQYIYGFPVPPLYNIDRCFKNNTLTFHCIPHSVASRILPLGNLSNPTK